MPTDLVPYIQLGATAILAIGLLSLVGKLIDRLMKQQAAREIAQRKEEAAYRQEIVATQARITMILDNHLGEISRHMAGSNELQRLILTRLDALKD